MPVTIPKPAQITGRAFAEIGNQHDPVLRISSFRKGNSVPEITVTECLYCSYNEVARYWQQRIGEPE